MAIATFFIIILYICFTFSYAELACAIPKAGGAFDYAQRAFGKNVGFLTGMAQNIEFIFAPPAIAFAIGAYFNIAYSVPTLPVAIAAYVLFTGLNIVGVKAAAVFELVITVLAVGELMLFAGLTLPHLQWQNLAQDAFPNRWDGVFACIPFAIWFFLGIEGVANVAEETVNPQRTILKGFGSAITTLVVLCVLTFASAVGVAGWKPVVYKNGELSDSPLPLALGKVVGSNDVLFHLLITVGLFGLVASFHGLMLAAGRSSLEFGRVRFAPAFLGKVHPTFRTPANALLVNMAIGIVALLTGETGSIITIAVFGAITLYVISMLALLKLRRTEPAMHRPFKTPLYPALPIVALVIGSASLLAMIVYNRNLAAVYFGILGVSFALFKTFGKNKGPATEQTTEA